MTGFRQRRPGDGTPISQPTRAYLSYDSQNLYVVFVCEDDDAGNLRANLAKREIIGDDDRVTVYLDTYDDNRRAYVFSANALGVQQDGFFTEGQGQDRQFDAVWYSEGQLFEGGYAVSMRIPFRSVRFSDASLDRWGIAFRRTIEREAEESYWPFITTRTQGFIVQFGSMTGLADVSGSRNIRLIPYANLAHARLLDRKQSTFVTEQDARVGLDAKFVFSDNVTLDLTVNPDFSQVESDDPQVTVNQRFEVSFPEKRPFFTENAAYFRTPINLFFSRRIVDPALGARFTGRSGGWTIGVLAANDRAADRSLPGSHDLAGVEAKTGVLRIQRDIGEQSHVGGIFTAREFGDDFNRVTGFDTYLQLSPSWSFIGQAVRSMDRNLNRKERDGAAFTGSLDYSSRSFVSSTSYADHDPNFRSRLGFVRRVDVRQGTQSVGYRWWPEVEKLQSFGPSFAASAKWDHSGRLQDWSGFADFAVEFTGQTFLNISRTDDYEFFGRGFRKSRYDVSVSTGWLTWLSLGGTWGQGDVINFSPAEGQRFFLANDMTASLSMTLRPSPRLRIDATYLYDRLGTGTNSEPGLPARTPIFNNHLARSKLNYQFTRELSLRLILDYFALLPNTSLSSLEPFKGFTSDLLLEYRLNPWTAVFAGYTDQREHFAMNPLSSTPGAFTDDSFVPVGRQFFIKLSYLLFQ